MWHKNNVALINIFAVNFGYEYFCSVNYFSNIFLSKLLSKIFFSEIFFPTFFSENFFPKFFSEIFFTKIVFKSFVIENYSRILILILTLILKKICWKKFAIVGLSKRKIENPKTAIQNLKDKNQNSKFKL